jgi:threonine dehydrogenase-like Zn-dependent dehydrogenase
MASTQAGADRIIVAGTSKDARRLEVARAFGADDVIDVENEDALARILETTDGRGVDVYSARQLAVVGEHPADG